MIKKLELNDGYVCKLGKNDVINLKESDEGVLITVNYILLVKNEHIKKITKFKKQKGAK